MRILETSAKEGGSTLENSADVIVGELNVGQASPRALGDETASWTKTMATGSLDSLVGFDPSFWGFFRIFIFKSFPLFLLGLGHVRSGCLPVDALERDGLILRIRNHLYTLHLLTTTPQPLS